VTIVSVGKEYHQPSSALLAMQPYLCNVLTGRFTLLIRTQRDLKDEAFFHFHKKMK
jgi:hypothetical protein